MAKVTIEDISRQTGLSRGTVSRALNDRPDISEQTKQRVLEACRRLNYSPSHAARSLATGRNFAVAVLVDHLDSPFAVAYLRGVLARAAAARYVVHVAELGETPEEGIRAAVTERIDCALVAAPLAEPALRALAEAAEQRPRILSSTSREPDADVLEPDYREAGRLIARELLRDGGEALYLQAPEPYADEKLAGVREVCTEQGRDPESLTVTLPHLGEREEDVTLERVLEERREVRFIAASSDALALRVMIGCMFQGRRPGQDFALWGQGDLEAGRLVRPALSTVDFSAEEIGRRAMDLALQRLGKLRMDAPQHIQVAPRLIARESSRLLMPS